VIQYALQLYIYIHIHTIDKNIHTQNKYIKQYTTNTSKTNESFFIKQKHTRVR